MTGNQVAWFVGTSTTSALFSNLRTRRVDHSCSGRGSASYDFPAGIAPIAIGATKRQPILPPPPPVNQIGSWYPSRPHLLHRVYSPSRIPTRQIPNSALKRPNFGAGPSVCESLLRAGTVCSRLGWPWAATEFHWQSGVTLGSEPYIRRTVDALKTGELPNGSNAKRSVPAMIAPPRSQICSPFRHSDWRPSSLIPGFALELESASVKPCSNLSAAVESNRQWI